MFLEGRGQTRTQSLCLVNFIGLNGPLRSQRLPPSWKNIQVFFPRRRWIPTPPKTGVSPGYAWSNAIPIRSGFPEILGISVPGYLWMGTDTSPASSNLSRFNYEGSIYIVSRSCEKFPFRKIFRNFLLNFNY